MIVYILVSVQIIFVQSINYQQPVAEKLWSTSCKTSEYVLNDCNWCWCGKNNHFQCQARVCEEVDKFGHFKDTIQEIDVGMEGHGAWRSKSTSCTPGVQYHRGTVLCICNDDGNWPNPVCRDLFRILYPVEVTEKTEESTLQTCSPAKLYLVGCNTCFCPSSGKLDATLCTNRTCSDGDPVLEPKNDEEHKKVANVETAKEEEPNDDHAEFKNAEDELGSNVAESNDYSVIKTTKKLEVYALCNTQKNYTIGRQKCKCLTNNRLICIEYDEIIAHGTKVEPYLRGKETLCSGKIGKVIHYGCNKCKCMKNGYMYCTINRCVRGKKVLARFVKKLPQLRNSVEAPIDDMDCVPGTTYRRGCNKCFCQIEKGQKIFGCTVKACHPEDEMLNMVTDCVLNTNYETDCLTCSCYVLRGEKYQVCAINSKCWRSRVKESQIESLDTLNGFCEPRHVYKRDCNTCTCMSDGKIIKCTTKPCVGRSGEPVEVEIVPLKQAVREICPNGHSYKVGCNLCVCLANGNALCTTSDCSMKLGSLT